MQLLTTHNNRKWITLVQANKIRDQLCSGCVLIYSYLKIILFETIPTNNMYIGLHVHTELFVFCLMWYIKLMCCKTQCKQNLNLKKINLLSLFSISMADIREG